MKYTFKSEPKSTYGFLGHVIDMTNDDKPIVQVFNKVFYVMDADEPINQEILDLVKNAQRLNGTEQQC